jgi:hypothetical protein
MENRPIYWWRCARWLKRGGGVRAIAKETELNANQLYRTLSPQGNPELRSLSAVPAGPALGGAASRPAPCHGMNRTHKENAGEGWHFKDHHQPLTDQPAWQQETHKEQ